MNISGESWFTVKQESTAAYRESGSKFIAVVFPVSGDDDIKDYLDRTRKKYFDATHICYASVLGRENNNFKAHDAGEPKHTAGDPILSQIRSLGVTDVLVVVVRYFGGKKLGRSGLVNAYKTAARLALEIAGREERISGVALSIEFDVSRTGDITRILSAYRSQVLSSHFERSDKILVKVRESSINDFKKLLLQIPGIRIQG